jgi:putative restriction endonuclease
MNELQIENKFASIRVWGRGDVRAPNKPLLVLYALGRCYRGEERLIQYQQIDEDLTRLLVDFGPPRLSYHTEYPFWRLRNDQIWDLQNVEKVEARKSNSDAKKSELLTHNALGGLSEPIYNFLVRNRDSIPRLAKSLLDAHFPESLHEEILLAVGIDASYKAKNVRQRDPAFREMVLSAYEYRCAVCKFNVRIGQALVGLEAAHIKWVQAGGPDQVENGIALCTMHHKLFDRGAFCVSDEMQIQVSERVHGEHGFRDWLLSCHGCYINAPYDRRYCPNSNYTKWHYREVFRQPARSLSLSIS